MPDTLGDRMKVYEQVANLKLTRRIPVIVRMDGRAFHTFTRSFQKPFDARFYTAMLDAAMETAAAMQNVKLGYTQSDEVSLLLLDTDRLETEPWLDNRVQRIASLAASTMTSYFGKYYPDGHPTFDARCFNIPLEEIANYFLWRARDWNRNSMQMLARAYFSHKELHQKSCADIHEMLHRVGVNWADLPDIEKNGAFFVLPNEKRFDVKPRYCEVAALVEAALQPREEEVPE